VEKWESEFLEAGRIHGQPRRSSDPGLQIATRRRAHAIVNNLKSIKQAQTTARSGNAVDAAVAVGFALSVIYPYGGNIGGGGFMLIRLADGRSTFIDFREAAPGRASRDMYLDPSAKPTRDSLEGWRSSAVPGTVRGFELAQSKYGRLK
jgi:gamma-glutamyltranspeptidase/glutathione hydrolase